MARIMVGGCALVDASGYALGEPGDTVELWRTKTGDTRVLDVLDAASGVLPGGLVTVDTDGLVPLVQPEVGAASACFASVGGGPRQVLLALAPNPAAITDPAAAAGATAGAAASQAYVAGVLPVVYVERYRAPGMTDLAVIQAAVAAATSLTKGAVVQLGPRTYDVGAGLSLAGMTCGLVGVSSSSTATAPAGTVLWASSQAGAVLDMTDWTGPSSERGRVEFGGFALRGSGVGPTTNHGWYQSKVKSGMHIRDVHIENTTGTGMHLNGLYLSDVSRITVLSPINAAANDVPHFRFRQCNGTRFRGLGMRSLLANGAPGGDCAPSGALQIEDGDYLGSPYSGHDILIEAPWVEYLHVPTGGTLISVKSNSTTISDLQPFDVNKEPGAVDTSYIRIDAAPFYPRHSNIVRGVIPGRITACPDYGVDIVAGSHLIQGAKGYNGYNVRLRSGVSYTTVILGGRFGAASAPAVQDDSGQSTNTLIDHTLGFGQYGPAQFNWNTTTSNRGFTILDKDAPTSGALWLGNSTGRMQVLTSGNFQALLGAGGTYYQFKDSGGVNRVQLTMSGNAAVLVTADSDRAAFKASTGWYEMAKETAPAAAPASTARLFVQDNGSGKGQLCVRFPTGAIQVIATEP